MLVLGGLLVLAPSTSVIVVIANVASTTSHFPSNEAS